MPETRPAGPGAWATPLRAGALLATVATLLLVAATLGEAARPHSAPPLTPAPPAVRPLSPHLALIVVDGLRFDIAVDPAKMPNFARRMRDEAHAEVWAGSVTTTSAAVLAMGAGQESDFAQVVMNLHAARARHNDLIANCRRAHVRVALAGDGVWHQAFGEFDSEALDRPNLALHVDNSAETLRQGLDLARTEPRPGLLIVHLSAPDHFGHGFGVFSPQYERLLRSIDERLERFYEQLPADVTVVALSDHGMLAHGSHGVSSDVERRTPLFAFGPGIRRGASLPRLSQTDLAGTFALLLGVSVPVHGLGTPAYEVLDLSQSELALARSAEKARVARLKAASGASGPTRTESFGFTGLLLTVVALWTFLAGMALVLARRFGVKGWQLVVVSLSVGLSLSLVSVLLTLFDDRAHPPFDQLRAAILWLASATMLPGLVRPRRTVDYWSRAPVLGAAVVPGFVICSFPTNTQVQSLVLLLLVGLTWAWFSHADARAQSEVSWRAPRWELVGMVVGVAALAPMAYWRSAPVAHALVHHEAWVLPAGLSVCALWLLIESGVREGTSWIRSSAYVAIMTGSVLLSHSSASWIGVAAMGATAVLAVRAWLREKRGLALALAFAAYGLVSRPGELVGVGGAALALSSVASLCAASSPRPEPNPFQRPWAVATLCTVLFAASYLCRVALQRGLDPFGMDFAAGSFGDQSVSPVRIGLAVYWKYCAAQGLLLLVFLGRLPSALKRSVGLAFLAACILRMATLVATLLVNRHSFVPSYRALGDLPWMLGATTATIVTVVILSGRRALQRTAHGPASAATQGLA